MEVDRGCRNEAPPLYFIVAVVLKLFRNITNLIFYLQPDNRFLVQLTMCWKHPFNNSDLVLTYCFLFFLCSIQATSPFCLSACEATSRNTTSWPGRGSAIASRDSSNSSTSARPLCPTWSSSTWWTWKDCCPPSTLSAFKSLTSPHMRRPSWSRVTKGSSGWKG